MLPSPAVPPAPPGKANPGVAAVLQSIERTGTWSIDGFVAALATDARLYREGPPAFRADAIRAALMSLHPTTFEPAGGDAARSGDLAYTYGAWRSASANGHYVHLWTRDATGTLRIAIAMRF